MNLSTVFLFILIVSLMLQPAFVNNSFAVSSNGIVGRLLIMFVDDFNQTQPTDSKVYLVGTNPDKNNEGSIFYQIKFNNSIHRAYADALRGNLIKLTGTIDENTRIIVIDSIGKITDDVSTWKRALTDAEISTLYNNGAGRTANSLSNLSGMLTYFNFDETSGNLKNQAIP